MIRRDPGMQPERTALAWDRTALTFALNAVLVLRSGLRTHSTSLLAAGMVLIGLAVALAGVGLIRRRQLVLGRPTAPAVAMIGLATASTALAGACGAWGILLE